MAVPLIVFGIFLGIDDTGVLKANPVAMRLPPHTVHSKKG